MADGQLDETLLFGEEEEAAWSQSGCSSDGDEGPAPAAAEARNGVEIAASSLKSGSIHSSTLRASLDERLTDAEPSGMIRARGGGYAIAASLPARTSAAAMGTSVPITIPSLQRWNAPDGGAEAGGGGGANGVAGGGGGGGGGDAPAPFVPPHKLTHQEDFAFSFAGASPSATLKRERLRTRNAVLRSTGFLEPQPGAAGGAASAGGAPGGVAQSLPASSGMARLEQARFQQQFAAQVAAPQKGAPTPSSLTAALSTIGEAT